MSKKSTLGPSYDGLEKICQNALSVTLFKQLSRAKIGLKFKNDQTIALSQENPQKVHSRPKLWASRIFEGGLKLFVNKNRF